MQIAREQIRSVRLDHQAIRWNVSHQWEQMSAAPLVVDPPGDADREPELETGMQLVRATGEAMSDGATCNYILVFTQDRNEVLVRIALMKEHRLVHACRDFELTRERSSLHIAR